MRHVTVVVIVIAVMLVARCGAQQRVLFAVQEEQPRGTLVADLFAELDTTNRIAIMPHMLQFFRFDERSGKLYTAVTFDAEDPQQLPQPCISNIFGCDLGYIMQRDGSAITIAIRLVDIDDNAPTFESSTVHLTLLENSSPGRTFALPLATDRDAHASGNLTYRLSPGADFIHSGLFLVEFDNRTNDLRLVVTRRLDYEAASNYSVVIEARDEADLSQTGRLLVFLEVLDENECAPQFDAPWYEATIYENEMLSRVFVASATDCDDKQQVSYSLIDSSGSSRHLPFEIGPDGVVSSVRPANYEFNTRFTGFVVARDSGEQSRQSRVNFTVHVLDVNDNAPMIASVSLASHCEADRICVSENNNATLPIALITASDLDYGTNAQVRCVLQPSDTNGPAVRLVRSETQMQSTAPVFHLMVDQSLDREQVDSLIVTITCSDRGEPPLSRSTNLTILVLDENDESPSFVHAQGAYEVEVPENAELRNFARPRATDADRTAPNNVVSYRFRDSSLSTFFSMNPSTGEISLVSPLDREVQSLWHIEVLAEDSGPMPLVASATVTVVVRDVNDCAPKFTKRVYEFSVPENQQVPAVVGQVGAVDLDYGRNAEVSFRLVLVTPEHNVLHSAGFTVSNNGTLTSRWPFDREMVDRVELLVLAEDHGDPPLTATTSVVITIDDENDNAPRFVSRPPNGSLIVNLRHVQNPLWTFTAHDSDTGENAALNYLLVDFEPLTCQRFFAIDHITGALYYRTAPSNFTVPLYCQLLVAVTDGGKPQRQTDTTMVRVTFVRYEQPESRHAAVLRLAGFSAMVVTIVCAIIFIVLLLIRLRRHARKRSRATDASSRPNDLEQDEEHDGEAFYPSLGPPTPTPVHFSRYSPEVRRHHATLPRIVAHPTYLYDELAQRAGEELLAVRTASILNGLAQRDLGLPFAVVPQQMTDCPDQFYATSHQVRTLLGASGCAGATVVHDSLARRYRLSNNTSNSNSSSSNNNNNCNNNNSDCINDDKHVVEYMLENSPQVSANASTTAAANCSTRLLSGRDCQEEAEMRNTECSTSPITEYRPLANESPLYVLQPATDVLTDSSSSKRVYARLTPMTLSKPFNFPEVIYHCTNQLLLDPHQDLDLTSISTKDSKVSKSVVI